MAKIDRAANIACMTETNSESSSRYEPKEVEEKIYKLWEESGYFNPDKLPETDNRKPYTIIMPPPNANGAMHVGHALFVTVEDILIRYQRMRGRRSLWLPGTDHAGFETQVVFEKKLEKEGRSRFQMKREDFYKEVWDFVQSNKHITENSLRRLGASCDWSRNIFTLDPRIVKIVYETFKKMYEDGLIYRGNRICNWCPKHQTGLSDLETSWIEREDPFYYLKYGPFTIATARPETKFGDKYVVVHPDDPQYAQYSDGQQFDLEWINGPIKATLIKDPIAIELGFGTGAMTITPWHDQTDFDLAQRRGLDMEPIIDKTGKLLPIAGEFASMHITKARQLIIDKLRAKGLVDEEKTDMHYKHNIQVCYKCGTQIEPQVVPQWYVAMTKSLPDGRSSLRDMATEAVTSGKVNILNERFQKTFLHWMEGLRDWPISRQIWWGIPIPVKYCEECKEMMIDIDGKINECTKCHSSKIETDPDTFDTWFSSGQWPYATLQAQGEQDLKTYFPTQVMETAADILFFWVARMIMFSYYRTGQPPFETVYLHGLVRDKDRQKMSKSKGNVIDPLGVIDIYGTDALRFALIFSTAAGNDIPLAEDKIKGMKHFCNKLWNIARFVLQNTGTDAEENFKEQDSFTPEEESVIAELGLLRDKNVAIKKDSPQLDGAELVDTVTRDLDSFRLHESAQAIYDSLWHHFADKYIEYAKDRLKSDDPDTQRITKVILRKSLEVYLKLLHPFMPFITEAVWQKMKPGSMLMVEKW